MNLISLKVIYTTFIYTFIITFSFSSYASNNDEEKYKYLDLFGQVFDRVRSSYVEEVSDQELIEKAIDGIPDTAPSIAAAKAPEVPGSKNSMWSDSP